MSALLQVVLLLAVSVQERTSSHSSKTDDSAPVLGTFTPEDILRDFLLSFTPSNTVMDVFVPSQCLEDNTALFKTFLRSRTQTVTLWTDDDVLYYSCSRMPCAAYRQMFLHIVYLVCGNYEISKTMYSQITDYLRTYFIVAENAQHPRTDMALPFLPPYPRASGRYVMRFENDSVLLNSEFERDLVVHQGGSKRPWLERQRKLSGSEIHLECRRGYACEHPSFNVTIELFKHRNATVRLAGYTFLEAIFLSTAVRNFDNDAKGYGYSVHRPLPRYGSVGFNFYVRKPDRVPKATIFVLPFSCEVWAGLLVSCLLLVLAYCLIGKVLCRPNTNLFLFIFVMMAGFVQQSVRIRRSLLTTQSSRLLYGLMILMFIVISTVFKGRLTSLLNDLPLQEDIAKFESFENVVRKGHRLCFLEHSGFLSTYNIPGYNYFLGTIKFGEECFETSNCNSRSIKISADGRDTFFTYNSPTGPSESLRRELLRRGYVETEGTAFLYPVGPEMRASSVYRKHTHVTLSYAIQAGLYVRSVKLAEYKSRSFHEGNRESTEGLILRLDDLAPFFVALFVGLSLSIIAFIGEVLITCGTTLRKKTSVKRISQLAEHYALML